MDIPQDRNMAAKFGTFLTSCGTTSFSKQILRHGVSLSVNKPVSQPVGQSVSHLVSRSASYPVSQSVG
jgi:hypothetical protein